MRSTHRALVPRLATRKNVFRRSLLSVSLGTVRLLRVRIRSRDALKKNVAATPSTLLKLIEAAGTDAVFGLPYLYGCWYVMPKATAKLAAGLFPTRSAALGTRART